VLQTDDLFLGAFGLVRGGELRGVEVTHLMTFGYADYALPRYRESFRHRALFTGSNVRQAVNDGRADWVPVHLSEIPGLITSGAIPVDVALIHIAPPDEHGFCSLGTSVEAMLAAIPAAGTVIAQVNRSMPRTHGEGFVHVKDIDLAIEVDIPPYHYGDPPIGDVERRIGEYVAELVPEIRLEVLLDEGSRLVVLRDPWGSA